MCVSKDLTFMDLIDTRMATESIVMGVATHTGVTTIVTTKAVIDRRAADAT